MEEKLNDDQRRALKSLPSLEATVKELEEVKKAVEVCTPSILVVSALIPCPQSLEADRVATEAREAAEKSKAEAERLFVAVAEAEVGYVLGALGLVVIVFARAKHLTRPLDFCTSSGSIRLSRLGILVYRRSVLRTRKFR